MTSGWNLAWGEILPFVQGRSPIIDYNQEACCILWRSLQIRRYGLMENLIVVIIGWIDQCKLPSSSPFYWSSLNDRSLRTKPVRCRCVFCVRENPQTGSSRKHQMTWSRFHQYSNTGRLFKMVRYGPKVAEKIKSLCIYYLSFNLTDSIPIGFFCSFIQKKNLWSSYNVWKTSDFPKKKR